VLETRELARGVALGKTLDFLGLTRADADRASDRNVGAYEPPDPAIERSLREYFDPHDERLSTLLDRTVDWHLTSG
jgi:hypothetical protein